MTQSLLMPVPFGFGSGGNARRWTASRPQKGFLFVDGSKGHLECCILPAGRNTHSDVPTHKHAQRATYPTHTLERSPDIMGAASRGSSAGRPG